jgi:hypothetical protein
MGVIDVCILSALLVAQVQELSSAVSHTDTLEHGRAARSATRGMCLQGITAASDPQGLPRARCVCIGMAGQLHIESESECAE